MRSQRAAALVSRLHQRGIMSMLPIMIGLAMAAAAIGAAQRAQQTPLNLHAPEQQATWDGVEIVRRYLVAVDAPTLAGLSGALDIPGYASLPVTIVGVSKNTTDTSSTLYQVVANISDGASATSKALLQVVYNVTLHPVSSMPSVTIGTINIYHSVDMGGGIAVTGDGHANLNVQGDAMLDHASITGIDSINATGDVSIGSGVHVNRVHANGDVTVTGNASVDQIISLGNVVIDGGANPFVITANGSVTFHGGSASSVRSIGDVDVMASGVLIGAITTMRNVNWTGIGGSVSVIHANGTVTYAGSNNGATAIIAREDVTLSGAGAQSVTTMGNVAVGGFGSIAALNAQGDLHLNTWCDVVGTMGGALTKADPYMSAGVKLIPGYTVTIPSITLSPLQPVSIRRPAIDAYAVQSSYL